MLVLSRHKDESILIADGTIRIVVIEVRGDKVRIGIEAPKDIDVHREEVYKAIQREKEAELSKPSDSILSGSLCLVGQDAQTESS